MNNPYRSNSADWCVWKALTSFGPGGATKAAITERAEPFMELLGIQTVSRDRRLSRGRSCLNSMVKKGAAFKVGDHFTFQEPEDAPEAGTEPVAPEPAQTPAKAVLSPKEQKLRETVYTLMAGLDGYGLTRTAAHEVFPRLLDAAGFTWKHLGDRGIGALRALAQEGKLVQFRNIWFDAIQSGPMDRGERIGIGICISSYHRPKETIKAFVKLCEAFLEHPNEYWWSVYIMEDCGGDADEIREGVEPYTSLLALRRAGLMEVVVSSHPENRGLGATRASATALALGAEPRPKYILNLDDDTFVKKNGIHQATQFMESNPRVGILGRFNPYPAKLGQGEPELPAFAPHNKTIAGEFVLMPSMVFDEIEGWDTRLRSREDVDITLQVGKAGWERWVTYLLVCIHVSGREGGGLTKADDGDEYLQLLLDKWDGLVESPDGDRIKIGDLGEPYRSTKDSLPSI